MIRIINDINRLSNNYNCLTDNFFCYPITNTRDVRFQVQDIAGVQDLKVEVYDKDYNNILLTLNGLQAVQQYFAYQIGNYIGSTTRFGNFQLIKPFDFNCFALKITATRLIPNVVQSIHYSEPICWIDEMCLNEFGFGFLIGWTDVNQMILNTDNETYNFDSNGFTSNPNIYAIDNGGGGVLLYVPCDVNVIDVEYQGSSILTASPTQVKYGSKSCSSYVSLESTILPKYDCNGNYYGTINSQGGYLESLIQNKLILHLPCAKWKPLPIEVEAKKIKESCNIYKSILTESFKIVSNHRIPYYYQKLVSFIMSNRFVVSGTTPIADDGNNLVEMIPISNAIGESGQHGNTFVINYIIESCPCIISYNC